MYKPQMVRQKRRPLALRVHVIASRYWRGYLSVRNDGTDIKTRIPLTVREHHGP
jgi:hypothetical protein